MCVCWSGLDYVEGRSETRMLCIVSVCVGGSVKYCVFVYV